MTSPRAAAPSGGPGLCMEAAVDVDEITGRTQQLVSRYTWDDGSVTEGRQDVEPDAELWRVPTPAAAVASVQQRWRTTRPVHLLLMDGVVLCLQYPVQRGRCPVLGREPRDPARQHVSLRVFTLPRLAERGRLRGRQPPCLNHRPRQ